jgi:aldose 1-epimerase
VTRCERFGEAADGSPLELYTLINRNGLAARIATYGGTLVSLHTPDRDGVLADVVLGFDDPAPYLAEHPYFGSLIGRFANRIRGGRFTLGGTTYQLPRNNGENHLHGGPGGFHTVNWRASASEAAGEASLTLTHSSRDGDQGYPGNVQVEVRYTLSDDDELRLDYAATTDAPTVLNLTNHSYFNLDGSKTILEHVLTLAASRYLPVDESVVPTGEMRSVAGTPFDFTTPTAIGARIDGDDVQLRHGRGYDHAWVLDHDDSGIAAEVYAPLSGRRMRVHTTQPGLQFYSGNLLDGTVRGKGGQAYPQNAGFCLETEHFPDSPNQPAFPSTVLAPGQVYRTATRYCFTAT